MNEYEASLIVKAGAAELLAVSADPRSGEGYAQVRSNLSHALASIAAALRNFESGTSVPSRSTEWAADLNRVADDLVAR